MSILIGEGSYGKVYRPALNLGETALSCKYVSKVMIEKHARHELEQYHKLGISAIDPTCRYHMGPPMVLTLDPPWTRLWIKDENTQQYHCRRYGIYSASLPYTVGERYMVLNYRDGGETLLRQIKTLRTARSATALRRELGHLKNIANGLALLHHHKIYHMDVNVSNIVTDKDCYRLIDFGMSIRDDRDLDHLSPDIYYFWPPEILLLQPIPRTPLTLSCYNTFVDKVNKDYPSPLELQHGSLQLIDQLNKTELPLLLASIDTWSYGQTIRWMYDQLYETYKTVTDGPAVLADMADLIAFCSVQDPTKRPLMTAVAAHQAALFAVPK